MGDSRVPTGGNTRKCGWARAHHALGLSTFKMCTPWEVRERSKKPPPRTFHPLQVELRLELMVKFYSFGADPRSGKLGHGSGLREYAEDEGSGGAFVLAWVVV